MADGDVERLFLEMRYEDRREVESAGGPDVLKTLRRSVEHSTHCIVATHDDQLLAIFGVAPMSLVAGRAAPWLLGTDRLEKHKRALITSARAYIGTMLREYPVLTNWVDARNVASVRLLKWLGFKIGPAEPFGFASLPFHRFEMRSDEIPCATRLRPHSQPKRLAE